MSLIEKTTINIVLKLKNYGYINKQTKEEKKDNFLCVNLQIPRRREPQQFKVCVKD